MADNGFVPGSKAFVYDKAWRAIYGPKDPASILDNPSRPVSENDRKVMQQRELAAINFLTAYYEGMRKRSFPESEPYLFSKLYKGGLSNDRSPLDAADEAGRCIVEIKTTNRYKLAEFDDLRFGGVGVLKWKLQHLQIACGMPGTHRGAFKRDHCFRTGLYVYLDKDNDVFSLSLDEIEHLIQVKSSLIRFDHFPNRVEILADPAWFIKSCCWHHLGNTGVDGKEMTVLLPEFD